eukprot:gnl/MRDRNA2_/MRDRNA2_198566_c0_seq1.p1 gnl/MRDRNA2_/MRDRNA2_198566_c0~~gnl/MRDRNA2_/MRDRNA2_198566_c0_seq1.p1  ORF type:complete len:177 (+),score=30.89 gnl/MRDRNA2_/MRDRNA2_198566_c0_seq1:1-531(+)
MGKKPKAMLRAILMRLQQYLESDEASYKKLMADPSDPGPLQEALMCIKQRAKDYEKDCSNVVVTRCFYVKYWSYEVDAMMIKFIIYCRNDGHLQQALEELIDSSDSFSPYGITFIKDEMPMSKDAKYCQKKLHEFYGTQKGGMKGSGKGSTNTGKGGGKMGPARRTRINTKTIPKV